MQELTPDQLKEILQTPHIDGTSEQVRLLCMRVSELCRLNGRAWVTARADMILGQWRQALCRMVRHES
jgi:hypothetical protein